MNKFIAMTLILFFSSNSLAALPPQYQNKNDLAVMIAFIQEHELVMASLTSIDFKNFTVYFSTDCKAVFGRQEIPRTPGWAGPASQLEFKSATCSVD